MLQITQPYECDFCKTMIETFFINTAANKFIFVCPTCKKSYEISEDEYLAAINKKKYLERK